MSSLSITRTLVRPLTTPSSIFSIPIKSLSTSSTRKALKEGDAKYERIKNENLRKVKEGKGGWNNELASESEASVKADRDETGISEEGVKKNDNKGRK
ncbi:hypothetical protein PISL3812_01180 [Talaromyces islandicus]|uniref:Uncharacterized protein n=1 Tax=Talaromyces islandicus TaxID=28573 RepID=A0A0U1LLB2_TALIS|nr:hypothetical protein PISL3812_01180 [Talaromyces islandicus]